MKKATIYDVAKEADVSLATVSRVINNSGTVKSETKQKVIDAIETLGFVPNAVAQGLALSKTTSIALIIPEASFVYISHIINGVIDVGKIYGYQVEVYTTNYNQDEVVQIIETVVKNRIDGIIVVNDELIAEFFGRFNKMNLPIVSIGLKLDDQRVPCVYVDYEKCMHDLIIRIAKQDNKRILFVSSEYNQTMIELMKKGIHTASAKQAALDVSYLKVTDNFETCEAELVEHFDKYQYDFVIGARDSLAIAALNAAKVKGIDVPGKMEIIGFTNSKYAIMSVPKLTTIGFPIYDLGAMAMRLVTKLLSDTDRLDQLQWEVQTHLHIRESTKDGL